MDPEINAYVAGCSPDEQVIIRSLIEIICQAEPRMETAIKWRRITFTVNGNWHHWVCGVEATRKYVSLLFHKGVLLDDPQQVLLGDGKHLRQMKFTSAEEIPAGALAGLVQDAVEKQTRMDFPD